MSEEKISIPVTPTGGGTVELIAVASVGNGSTELNGVIQTATQPNITTLASVTALGTNTFLPNGNLSIGANVDVSELYIANSDTTPTNKSGLVIHQDSSTADAQLHLNTYGTKAAIGIDQSDGYKFKISRSQSLDASPAITIDPNYVSSTTAVSTWTARATPGSNAWFSICWSPELRIFVATALNGSGDRVMTSPNGITWTIRTSAADNQWQSVCWSPELRLFCTVSYNGSGNRVMTSPDGITWTTRTSAADNSWQGVCWSPELRLFCAVSSTGTSRVMTSPDGITWTLRTSAADNQWNSVCWSPKLRLFCAVAFSGVGNRVMTSQDGITWTARVTTSFDNQWQSVCWSPELSLFCAVSLDGTGNRVMTSPDGITWTARTSAADNQWYSVCWSSELRLFCAVAQSGTGNRIMTSPDGITWTLRTNPVDNNLAGVCWSPELGIFCIVCYSGTSDRAMTSSSIYANTPTVTFAGTLTVNNLANNLYLQNGNASLGYNKDVSELYVYNSDSLPTTKSGVTIHQDASTADAHLQLNAYGTKSTISIDQSDGYKFKISRGPQTDANPIVTLDPNYVASATAVSTWTTRTSAADNEWFSVCWSSELRLFCAVSANGVGNRVMTSPDGINWTSRTSAANNNWYSVCWSPDLKLFCAVAASGTDNRVMTSPDGINWTSRTSAANNEWLSVCWSPELRIFCAVASSGTGNHIMTSPDGITWTSRAPATDEGWAAVCWSPELRLFAAVAEFGTNRVMTSPDGITWTNRTAAAANAWRGICWSPELRLFCSVAYSVGVGNRVMTSPDGITWTARSTAGFDNDWISVCWSSELKLFCSVSLTGVGNRVMTSPDGITWTTRTSAANNQWLSVCWSPELGIFASTSNTGTGNRVMTSSSMYANAPNITVAGIRGKTTGVADAIQVVIDSTGQLGTVSSSETKKHEIRNLGDFTSRLYDLNPVIFKWKPEECKDQTDQYGLIAEHTAEVFPELAVIDPKTGQPETVAYQNLVIMLLNEVKKLKLNYIEKKAKILAYKNSL